MEGKKTYEQAAKKTNPASTNSVSHATNGEDYLESSAVKRILHYRNSAAFFAAVRSQAIPCLWVNRRRVLFPTKAFRAWLERRTVGGAK